MLKSLQRSIKLINKDEFDTALFKATFEDNTDKPKDKHLKVIELCLYGEDKKILPLDAFTRFNDQIHKLNFIKWIHTLKYAYILHHCLQQKCKLFIEAMCQNDVFTKLKHQNQSHPKDDPLLYLHFCIASNYINYLHHRYEHYLYFSAALEDFDQKEESQKVLIIHKLLEQIHVLIRIYKELDLSLQKTPNCHLIIEITTFLLQDLQTQYPIVHDFLIQRVDLLTSMDVSLAIKLYSVYTNTLRITRAVRQMSLLRSFLNQPMPEIKIFQIQPERNKQIELHFKNMAPSNSQSPSKSFEIIQFHEENNKIHSNESSEEQSPPKQQQQQLFLNLRSEKTAKNTPINQLQLQKTEIQIPSIKQCATIKQSEQTFFDPKPDEIKIQPQKSKTQRLNLDRKRAEQNDASSYFSVTTQQSFITTSDMGEARIIGLNRTESIQSSATSKKEGFFDNKYSPLAFLRYEPDTPGINQKKQFK